jgi:hypothetical protein
MCKFFFSPFIGLADSMLLRKSPLTSAPKRSLLFRDCSNRLPPAIARVMSTLMGLSLRYLQLPYSCAVKWLLTPRTQQTRSRE